MLKRKTDFQRLVKTLFNEKAEGVPLIELGIHPLIRQQIAGKPILSLDDEFAFMRSLGYDFVKIQPKITLELNRKSAANSNVAPDRSWSSEHSGIITNFQEFEAYPWPAVSDISYERLESARELIPDDMGVVGQYGDIYTTIWEMMGFENFSMAIYTDTELVEALFEKVGSLIYSMFETMAQMEWVGVLWYSDDIAYSSGPMINPDFYRQWLFPWLKKIGKLAKERQIPFIYHSDGVLYDVIPDILECGVTALHPLEPLSMEIGELKARHGHELCLCGGVDVDQLSRATPDEIRRLTKSILEKAAINGGYAAGSSNSIPEYVKAENYLAMIETVLAFQQSE
jgi:uroporphyrinogen decarboxylase